MTWYAKFSTPQLRTILAMKKEAERLRLNALGGPPSLETDPWDYYSHERAEVVIADIEDELRGRV